MVKIYFAQLLKQKWIAIFQIFIIMFGIYLIFQILIKVFGGSWTAESLVIGLLVLNVSLTSAMGVGLAKIGSDQRHLGSQFRCMAVDFKRLSGQFTEHKIEFRHLSAEFREQKAEAKGHSDSLRRIEQALKRSR